MGPFCWMQGTSPHLRNTSVGCTNHTASSDSGASEGTEHTNNADMISNLVQLSSYIPAVNVLIYTEPVESTLPPLNPDWLTVNL